MRRCISIHQQSPAQSHTTITMCVIIPIDHTQCSHTVPIWQHCANAPRSVFGHKPCAHIRQHGRPIMTRKSCHSCGGPRFFARRGGIAARGSGSSIPMLKNVKEQKEDPNEQYDSGYQSDIVPDMDEDASFDDAALSPRQPAAATRWWASKQCSSNIPRTSGPSPNWRPNLKRDLSETSSASSISSSRRSSIDHAISRFDSESIHAFRARLSSSDRNRLEQSFASTPRRPSPHRKGSTLLHPSPPPAEPLYSVQRTHALSIQDLTPPTTPPSRPGPPMRQSSTLLHPSSPDHRPTSNISEDMGYPFTFSLPAPITLPPIRSPAPTSAPSYDFHGLPPRKNSTLLHPSPPNDESVGNPFFVPMKTIISLPPTPQGTPRLACSKRYSSSRSSRASNEWEEPLHSSHSDAEYDSDDQCDEADTESAHGNSLMMARASRISFYGNQLRILQH